MFVADNNELLVVVEKTMNEPVFVGFKALNIMFEDCEFVKYLPPRLQPKLLSEACHENLHLEAMQEESFKLFVEIWELMQTEEFKTGVLRIINHYKLKEGSHLMKKKREGEEIVDLLAKVAVRQFSIIKTTLTLHNKPVGK